MKSFTEALIWLPLAASVGHPHILDAVSFRCERVNHIDSKIYIPSAFIRLGLAQLLSVSCAIIHECVEFLK